MKYLIRLAVFPALLSLAASAQAEIGWVKTPFWQAPVPRALTIKLTSADKGLSEACAEYRDIVVSSPGKTTLEASEIHSLRNETGTISFSKFKATFKLDVPASKLVLADELGEANSLVAAQAARDLLPYFTLSSANVLPQLNPRGETAVVSTNESLTAISRSLGLKPQKITVLGEGESATFQVIGKDVACDLLAGAARLEFDSEAKVQISLDDQRRSDELYRQIETLTSSVYAKKSSVVGRAALMGYHLPELLAPLRLSDDRVELMISALLEGLFDQNLQRNSHWKTLNGEAHLTITGTVPTMIRVRAER